MCVYISKRKHKKIEFIAIKGEGLGYVIYFDIKQTAAAAAALLSSLSSSSSSSALLFSFSSSSLVASFYQSINQSFNQPLPYQPDFTNLSSQIIHLHFTSSSQNQRPKTPPPPFTTTSSSSYDISYNALSSFKYFIVSCTANENGDLVISGLRGDMGRAKRSSSS